MKTQLTLAGLIALQLTGCAYSSAMRHGDRAAASGDWRTALVEYQKATAKKDHPDAVAAVDTARTHAVEEALDSAHIAIERGAWESAMSEITYVASVERDNADIVALKSDLIDSMRSSIANHIDLNNIRTAYANAVRMRAIFPSDSELPATFEILRNHYIDEAQDRLKRGEYELALESARTIVEFEPDRKSHVGALEQKILVGWSDAIAKEATAHSRAGRKGAAAMLYARAYEVAGRQDHLQSAQDLAKGLAGTSRFDLSLKITGAPDRARQIREAVETAVGKLPDVGEAKRDTLTVTVAAAGQRCSETREATPSTKDYISGQIEVPNPRHGELTTRLAQVQEAGVFAKLESERLWPEVQNQEASLKFFDELVGMANRQLQEATNQLTQAQQQLERAEAKRAEIEAHLVELRAVGPGTEATIARRETELGQIGGVIAQWQGVVIDGEFKVGQAQKELDGLNFERKPAAEAFARIEGGYKAQLADWQRYQQEESKIKGELAHTSETVMEDVHETLAYDVLSWTRTCSAPTRVSMKPTWRTELPTTQDFDPEGSTEDQSHIGHALAALTEDPKAYPKADAELWAEQDAATANEIGAWIGRLVDDYYEVTALQTTMAMRDDPIRASDQLLGLYLGAPSRVDEATLLTFKSHAREHFQLESLELLRTEGSGPLASR